MKRLDLRRLLLKAVTIFFVLNFLYILVHPMVSHAQVYNHLVGGRLRFPYAQPQFERVAHAVSVYDDMDAMFASHVISSETAPSPDEFRVIFLGDSSFWGAGILPENSLPGRINSLDLVTCNQKHVHAYNLAFPSLYVMKDVLILQKAMEYKPDLIVWGVTLKSLENSSVNAASLLPPYSDDVLAFIHQYEVRIPVASLKPATTIWDQTLWSHRADVKNLMILQVDAFPWLATGLDYDEFSSTQIESGNDISPDNKFISHAKFIQPENLLLDVLGAADQIAGGIPILIVNEPIFIAGGRNSDRYYNNYYSRQLYDQYRDILTSWAKSGGQPYFDAWNLLPRSVFTNTPLHISAGGEAQFASDLAPEILKLSCR